MRNFYEVFKVQILDFLCSLHKFEVIFCTFFVHFVQSMLEAVAFFVHFAQRILAAKVGKIGKFCGLKSQKCLKSDNSTAGRVQFYC